MQDFEKLELFRCVEKMVAYADANPADPTNGKRKLKFNIGKFLIDNIRKSDKLTKVPAIVYGVKYETIESAAFKLGKPVDWVISNNMYGKVNKFQMMYSKNILRMILSPQTMFQLDHLVSGDEFEMTDILLSSLSTDEALDSLLYIAARRERMYKNRPKCPSCKSKHVRLIDGLKFSPIQWACRSCNLVFMGQQQNIEI